MPLANKAIELLGETLRKPDGTTVSTEEALADKAYLALYFSAHWCPPCRGFTPELSEKYTALKEAGKDFEMVFVSSDKDEAAFNDYHKEMTFLALPYEKRDEKAKLSSAFGVSGIPTLVFVDVKTGKLITDDGRSAVMTKSFVDDFPYYPPTLKELLGESLRKPDGTTVSTSEAVWSKPYLALYFSAHWCPPCRGFTPELSKKYTALKEAGKDFEMVFVSSDYDDAAFKDYHKEMTFLALPYEKRDEKAKLSSKFSIDGIPSLIFIDTKTEAVITDEGRSAVSTDSYVKDFPYHPKPLNDLSGSINGINDKASLVVMMEKVEKKSQDEITDLLQGLAKLELAKAEDEQVVQRFFTGKGGGPAPRIRQLCSLGEASEKPEVLLLDLKDQGSYYRFEKDSVTKDNIVAFMKAFENGELKKEQLSC